MKEGKGHTKSGQRVECAGRMGRYVAEELVLRQDNRCFGEGIPIQALSAAVTVGLVLPFHSPSALGADWETSKAVEEVKAADLHHRHGLAEGHLPPNVPRGSDRSFGVRSKPTQSFSKVRIVGAVLPLAMSPKYLELRSHRSEAAS